jgi:hypothetical protein
VNLAPALRTARTVLLACVLVWTQATAALASSIPAQPKACPCCACNGCECCVETPDGPAQPAPLAFPPAASLTETLCPAWAALPLLGPVFVPIEPALAGATETASLGLPLYRQHCALLI